MTFFDFGPKRVEISRVGGIRTVRGGECRGCGGEALKEAASMYHRTIMIGARKVVKRAVTNGCRIVTG